MQTKLASLTATVMTTHPRVARPSSSRTTSALRPAGPQGVGVPTGARRAADGAVLLAPALGQTSGLLERVEDFVAGEFIPELRVEGLYTRPLSDPPQRPPASMQVLRPTALIKPGTMIWAAPFNCFRPTLACARLEGAAGRHKNAHDFL